MDVIYNDSIRTEHTAYDYGRLEVPYLIFVCILGSLGNALVIAVYTRSSFRGMNSSCYILNLAAGDLLALVVVLFHLTEFFPVTWPILWAYTWQCAIHRYFRFVGFNNTVMTMMAIAVDRYYAVRKPIVFKLKFSLRRTKITVLLLWALSLMAAIPTAFMFQSIYANEDDKTNYAGKSPFACKLSFPPYPWFPEFKALYLHVVLFIVPVTITGVLFVGIFVRVRENNASISRRFDNAAPRSCRRSHYKTARSLLVVFLVFVLCYFPFAVYNLCQRYAPGALPATFSNVALLLPYANSCMNPVVYSFTSKRFRVFSWRLLRPTFFKRPLNIRNVLSSINNATGFDSPQVPTRERIKPATVALELRRTVNLTGSACHELHSSHTPAARNCTSERSSWRTSAPDNVELGLWVGLSHVNQSMTVSS